MRAQSKRRIHSAACPLPHAERPSRAAARSYDEQNKNGLTEGVTSQAVARQPVTPLGKPLRLRNPLKFISAQPCLACSRSPSDGHHLKFCTTRAMGRKVSDEFAIPLCRTYHRELHSCGNESAWWSGFGVDPLPVA